MKCLRQRGFQSPARPSSVPIGILYGAYRAHARYLVGAITQASSMEPLRVNMRGFLPSV